MSIRLEKGMGHTMKHTICALLGTSILVSTGSVAAQSSAYNGPDGELIRRALEQERLKRIQQERAGGRAVHPSVQSQSKTPNVQDQAKTHPASSRGGQKRQTQAERISGENIHIRYGKQNGSEGYRVHPASENRRAGSAKKSTNKVSRTALWVGGLGALGGAALLLGSSGGGGGDDSGGGGGGSPLIEGGEDPLRSNLAQINAQAAYDRGFTGDGILVAVVDSGVDGDHPELDGKLDSESFDFILFRGNSSPLDEGDFLSHGTNAAGIIAANRDGNVAHGVAYDARILGIRAGDSDGSIFLRPAADGIIHAVDNGARVINNSYGTDLTITDASNAAEAELFFGDELLEAVRFADENNVINVWSNGNEGREDANVEAGLPFFFPELQDTWIAVASVDENNNISSFSNRCGVAAQWCVVAPGENIVAPGNSENSDEGYDVVSGTSFSAPHVSGAVAILLEAFPSLTPQQVVELLLETATDLGEPGVDEVFGRGLVNLDEATQPQGALSFATDSNVVGNNIALADTTINTGGAIGDAILNAQLSTAIIDRFERTFLLEVNDVAERQNFIENAYEVLSRFGAKKKSRHVQVGENARLTLSGKQVDRLENLTKKGAVQSASFVSDYKNLQIAAHYNLPVEEVFNFAAVEEFDLTRTLGAATHKNPYLSFASEGNALISRYEVSEYGSVRIAAFSGSGRDTDYQVADEKVYGFVGEYTQKLSHKIHATVQLGVLSEEESLLGSRLEGAFGVDGGARTFFAGAAGQYNVSPRLSFFATANVGLTDSALQDGGSLIQSLETLYSDSFSLGAIYKNLWKSRDSFGVSISQPLRVSSGQAGILLSTGRSLDGGLNYVTQQVELSPSGREIDVEAFYSLPLGKETELHTGALLRSEPGHVKDAPTDNVVLMRLNHAF